MEDDADVTTPKMRRRTMTPTMTRMILRALLPPLEGGGPGVMGCDSYRSGRNRRATFAAEFCSVVELCTARITEGHGSPRGGLNGRVYRRWDSKFKSFKVLGMYEATSLSLLGEIPRSA